MRILVTGGTGYIGSRLASALTARGHSVRALVRSESAGRLPAGVSPIIGNALDAASIAGALDAGDARVRGRPGRRSGNRARGADGHRAAAVVRAWTGALVAYRTAAVPCDRGSSCRGRVQRLAASGSSRSRRWYVRSGMRSSRLRPMEPSALSKCRGSGARASSDGWVSRFAARPDGIP